MKYFLFLTTLIFLMGCSKEQSKEANSSQLLLDLTNNERYASIEQVADWIINQDPSLLLVDVRGHIAYDAFSLPKAVNIPLENLLDAENREILDCERYRIVFFSNDDLAAANAWMLSRRIGCRNNYIMQGGLNRWTETILSPPKPESTASAEEIELYQFRKAICQYFIGGSKELTPEKYEVIRQPAAVKKKIEVKPKKKKVEEEEGC